MTEEVEYPGLGWFHLSAATGGGVPDGSPKVLDTNGEHEWTPEEAVEIAERFTASMREFAAAARSSEGPDETLTQWKAAIVAGVALVDDNGLTVLESLLAHERARRAGS